MLTSVAPKLPMRNIAATKEYYIVKLAFRLLADHGQYLLVEKDNVCIHFFEFKDLDLATNYGQVYINTDDVAGLYQSLRDRGVVVHPNGHLETKPWGQKEFALLDPDNNLLTFGQNMR